MAKKTKLTNEEMSISVKAIKDAVELFGSQNKLAIAIGTSRQRICSYLNDGMIIPVHWAVEIEIATGGKIKRSRLRPDIF